jgi:hypothetical protein
MTDSGTPQTTPENENDLEGLVNDYVSGVDSPTGEGGWAWLKARSTIEDERENLTTGQIERVEKADRKLTADAGDIALKLEEDGHSLADARKETGPSADQWWWYLDVIDAAADVTGTKLPSRGEQIFSRLIDVLLLVALAVLAFLLVRQYLPQLQGANNNSSASVSSPFPTSAPITPSLTPTVNPLAFDYSQAKVLKTTNDVIEINLPPGWEQTPADPTNPSPYPNQYTFAYGGAQSPVASILLFVDTKSGIYALYERFFSVTFKDPQNPQDAMKQAVDQIKKNLQPSSGITIDDPVTVKIGGVTDGYGIAAHFQANAQNGTGASESEYWVGTLPDGRMVAVVIQGNAGVWPTAKPTIYKMLESLVVNVGKIATPTPTNTLNPLMVTATALQNLIGSLTPTPTPTQLGGTPAATGAATGAATQSANNLAPVPSVNPPAVGTQSATSASTSAATSASTSASTLSATTGR